MIVAVTNRRLVEKGKFLDVIERIASAGVDRIILREKDLKNDALYALAEKVQRITHRYKVELIINSNIETALRLKCYAVHLPYRLFEKFHPIQGIRYGVSIHTLNEARYAEEKGADYLLAGHIFSTSCKPDLEPRGLSFIQNLAANIKIPIIAIGGIQPHNAQYVYKAGASGIAVMSLLMTVDNIDTTVNQLNRLK